MPAHRRPRSLRAAALIVGGLTSLAVAVPVGIAHASTAPTASAAPSSAGCAFSTGVGVQAFGPVKTGPGTITFSGAAASSADTCGHDLVRVVGQRIVCGSWGCNPREVAASDWMALGVGRSRFEVNGVCEPGTYKYRTLVQYRRIGPEFGPGTTGGVADIKESGAITC